MSWSNRWLGKPSAILKAIDRFGDTLTGNNLAEFESAKGPLKGLVGITTDDRVVSVDASGHAYDGHACCQVAIKDLGILTE